MSKADVLVIGGGVIGVSLALELARRGVGVAVVDRGRIGHGSSYGNAGWLTPSFAYPLPAPGVLGESLRWLLDPESPLYIKPSMSPTLAQWLWRFVRKMNRRDYERGVEALVPLSKYSLGAYKALDDEFPGTFGFAQSGLLVVAESTAGLASAARHAEHMAHHGLGGRVMNAAEVRAFEPAVSGPIVGGVFLPGEAQVEPLAVVETMARAAETAGARFAPGVEVFDFVTAGGRVVEVRTTAGPLQAEQFVLAAGAWSMALARKLGVSAPVLGGKGYAVVVETFSEAPRVPIKPIERRLAITPRADSVRFGGTLELVDADESISPRRVAAIMRGSRAVLGLEAEPVVREVWRGLRPCTPDGLPIIGRPGAWSNLTIATGHQMLGLHSAPGSARLTADIILGAAPTFDPQPFRPGRF